MAIPTIQIATQLRTDAAYNNERKDTNILWMTFLKKLLESV